MNRNIRLFTVGAVVFVLGFVGGVSVAFASEQEEPVGTSQGPEGVPSQLNVSDADLSGEDELSEEEKQVVLAQIAAQLEQLEQEVLRLSLIVQLKILEEQALALERQLQEKLASLEKQEQVSEIVSEEAQERVVREEPSEEQERALTIRESIEGSKSEEEKSAISEIALEQVQEEGEEKEEGRGFLAALGFRGNLGTPELAVVILIAFVGAFMLMRRLRERRKSPEKTAPASFLELHQEKTIDQSKQELKEQIAWK